MSEMKMSDRPTTSVIARLKKIVEEEEQKHIYQFSSGTKFNISDMHPLKQIEKCPTTRETRKYLISRIRWNMLYKDITTQQYRSLKGEIRRGNIIGPVHFIRKFVSGQTLPRGNDKLYNDKNASCCRENTCNSSNYDNDKYNRY